jgi:AcrR family transcriptional regulator
MPEALLSPRRTSEFRARRRFIVDAARGLLAAQGVEETSMDAIAAAAEYTRRTLYAYFKSRDEILLLALRDDLAARWALQKEAISGASAGLDKIRTWARVAYAYACDNPRALELQAYWDFRGIDRARIGDDVFAEFESINDELAEGLRDLFRLGIRDGSLRADLNVDLTISQFIYALRAVLHRALTVTYSFTTAEPDEYVEHFLQLFCRSIRNNQGATS